VNNIGKRFARLAVVAVLLTLTSPSPGQAAANDWRDAEPNEFVGGWEYSKDLGKQNPFWYVVILEDGHIGWIYSKEKLTGVTKSSLIDMINKGPSSGVPVSGFEAAHLSPGNIEIPATTRHVDEYFAVWIGVIDQNRDSLVIGQTYRFPPPPPGSDQRLTPPPHMPALELHDLHRLPD
jgi:hypothetical protein